MWKTWQRVAFSSCLLLAVYFTLKPRAYDMVGSGACISSSTSTSGPKITDLTSTDSTSTTNSGVGSSSSSFSTTTSSSLSTSSIGILVGASVAGAIGLILLIAVLIYCLRIRNRPEPTCLAKTRGFFGAGVSKTTSSRLSPAHRFQPLVNQPLSKSILKVAKSSKEAESIAAGHQQKQKVPESQVKFRPTTSAEVEKQLAVSSNTGSAKPKIQKILTPSAMSNPNNLPPYAPPEQHPAQQPQRPTMALDEEYSPAMHRQKPTIPQLRKMEPEIGDTAPVKPAVQKWAETGRITGADESSYEMPPGHNPNDRSIPPLARDQREITLPRGVVLERSDRRRPAEFSTATKPFLRNITRIPNVTVNQRIPRWAEQASGAHLGNNLGAILEHPRAGPLFMAERVTTGGGPDGSDLAGAADLLRRSMVIKPEGNATYLETLYSLLK